MQKSDFAANYTKIYGRGNYLHRELLDLVEHAEMHPQTAAQLLAAWDADAAIVRAALVAAQLRDGMSGPGGGPWAPALASIAVAPPTASIAVGATRQLAVTKSPSNAPGTATYVSSDPTKATVNASGLVTGVAAGTTTITATVGSKTATCAVTVTA